jgi:DNA-binding transcriptional MerR regulator
MNEANYILIQNAFMMSSDIAQPNAALLIQDKKQIDKIQKLFQDNGRIGHACGYHYVLQFWSNSDAHIESIAFNQDCEEFHKNNRKIQSIMQGAIKQLETQPPHYIYNLKVPVSTNPPAILQAFSAHHDLNLFFLNGTSAHYTSLTFTYSQISPIVELEDRSKWPAEQDENKRKALEKFETIIQQIETVTEIKERGDISFPMQSFGAGKIEHKGQITLRFDNGTNLEKIKEIITHHQAEVKSEYTPEHHFVQLVHESNDLNKIREITEVFDFIEGVYEYPKRK